MARSEDAHIAQAMKEAATASAMVQSWGEQRPGVSLEGTFKNLQLYIDRKPEMVSTFAHNQLTQVVDRGILDKKTRPLVALGVYMALKHWVGVTAQVCNAKAAGCTDEEIMEVAFMAGYGASKAMLVESCQALTGAFESESYKNVKTTE